MTNDRSLHVRWMIRADMPEVLAIESACFANPWSEDEFIRCLRQRNCVGMVADYRDTVIAFMVYEMHKTRLQLLDLAVHEDYQRQGVGRRMMSKVFGKLSANRRTRVACEVRETNVDAQMFFKAQGFRAVNTLRDFYEDTAEDAYLFQYRFRRTVDCGEADQAAGKV